MQSIGQRHADDLSVLDRFDWLLNRKLEPQLEEVPTLHKPAVATEWIFGLYVVRPSLRGADKVREPGVHNHRNSVWIPGSRPNGRAPE